MEKETVQRFYVRNPISIGDLRHAVRVVGHDAVKGQPYTVPRAHVIEVAPGAAARALAKWAENRCIEPYNPKKHKDAILTPALPTVILQTPMVDEALVAAKDNEFSQSSPIADVSDAEGGAPEVAAAKPSEQSSPIAQGTGKKR